MVRSVLWLVQSVLWLAQSVRTELWVASRAASSRAALPRATCPAAAHAGSVMGSACHVQRRKTHVLAAIKGTGRGMSGAWLFITAPLAAAGGTCGAAGEACGAAARPLLAGVEACVTEGVCAAPVPVMMAFCGAAALRTGAAASFTGRTSAAALIGARPGICTGKTLACPCPGIAGLRDSAPPCCAFFEP
eukprot:151092-Rhodomonas_salina.1